MLVRHAMVGVESFGDGKMPKGRPGGNPDLEKYQFQQKYEWEQPCSEKVSLRVPPFMKEAIKAGEIKNWQEVVRQAIAAALDETSSQVGEKTRTATTEPELN